MILPTSSRWQRVAITALLVLPLLLIVLLSAPAWAVLPFLSESRRDTVLKFLGCLTDWIKAIVGPVDYKPVTGLVLPQATDLQATVEPPVPNL